MKKKWKVVWDNQAKADLKDYCDYIKRRSSAAMADKVRKTLIGTSKLLKEQPELFAPDPWMYSEQENIRSYTKWSYRITYQVMETMVVVLKVTHTSQEPLTGEE